MLDKSLKTRPANHAVRGCVWCYFPIEGEWQEVKEGQIPYYNCVVFKETPPTREEVEKRESVFAFVLEHRERG